MKITWQNALDRMSYGIYLLTTAHGEEKAGMIASWVSQVSYEPPLVMIAVHRNRHALPLIRKSGCFALNILSVKEKGLLNKFKRPDPERRFDQVSWKKGTTGCPLLLDSLGFLEFRLERTLTPGNHTLFFGKVVNAEALNDGDPMTTLDHDGVYRGRN